jgi:hypothetical protein
MFSPLTPRRRRALVWIIIGVLALLLLAGGLSTFTLQPGRSFQLATPEPTAAAEAPLTTGPASAWPITLMKGVLAVLLLLFPVSVIFAMLSKEGRKRLITNAVMIAMVLLLLNGVQKMQRQFQQMNQPDSVPSNAIGQVSSEPLPPPPEPPSDEFVLVTTLVIVVLGGVMVLWFGRRWLFPKQTPALEQIAEEADRARTALADGGAVEDVVVRCYRQMSRIVAEARDLRRSQSATPREFETTLVKAGLPLAPLDALTHLFEDVRYGGVQPGPKERQAAIDSLTAISAACRDEQNANQKNTNPRWST